VREVQCGLQPSAHRGTLRFKCASIPKKTNCPEVCLQRLPSRFKTRTSEDSPSLSPYSTWGRPADGGHTTPERRRCRSFTSERYMQRSHNFGFFAMSLPPNRGPSAATHQVSQVLIERPTRLAYFSFPHPAPSTDHHIRFTSLDGVNRIGHGDLAPHPPYQFSRLRNTAAAVLISKNSERRHAADT
jgi:hypothetical protein